MTKKPSARRKLKAAPDPRFEELVQEVAESAPRQYARWNEETYGEHCRSGGALYWRNLQNTDLSVSEREAIMTAWLKLLREAVGTAVITPGMRETGNFLSHSLGTLAPRQLPELDPQEQLETLVSLWNLAEGLAGEPSWVGQYVASRISELPSLLQMKDFLVEVLDPVLSPGQPSSWKGPFQHTIVDLRDIEQDFLPGEITLVAPQVLCITDRLCSHRLGVLLQKNRRSKVIGPIPPTMPYHENWEFPALRWEPNVVRVNEQLIPFPYLNARHTSLITRGGFLVATALDSQRLWIAESL